MRYVNAVTARDRTLPPTAAYLSAENSVPVVSLIGEIAMSEIEKSEKTQAQILRDVFEGMKGRQPKSDQELKQWLATDEGKEATLFEATALSTWGDKARS